MKLRYTEAEFQAIAEAARHAGLTATGYAAEAALAAAQQLEGPSVLPLRTALVEVMAARGQVRRFAVNVNQAVAALHATGQAPEWLSAAVAVTTRAVERLDAVADTLAVAARRPPRRRTPATPDLVPSPSSRPDDVSTEDT